MSDAPTQAQIEQAYDELITEGVLNEKSTIKDIRITLAEAFDFNHDNDNEIRKFISSLSFGQTGGEGKRKSRKNQKKSKKYRKKSKKYRKKSKKHHKKSKKSRRKRR